MVFVQCTQSRIDQAIREQMDEKPARSRVSLLDLSPTLTAHITPQFALNCRRAFMMSPTSSITWNCSVKKSSGSAGATWPCTIGAGWDQVWRVGLADFQESPSLGIDTPHTLETTGVWPGPAHNDPVATHNPFFSLLYLL